MCNDLFSIGPVTIHGYGLMIVIGIITAYLTADYRAKKKGWNSDVVIDYVIFAVVFGFLGAKILYIIARLGDIIKNPSELLTFASGWVVFGGIIGGIFGGWLCAVFKKVEFWKYFDLVLTSVALAQGFGRIGCLLAGCCYGAETESAFHIVFHNSAFAPNDVWLIPTQIMSSGLDFINFGLLLLIDKKIAKGKDGVVGGFYLVFYSIGRFFIEFFRGDLIRGQVGALSTSQFIGIFAFIIGILLVVLAMKGKLPVRKMKENRTYITGKEGESSK